MAHDDANELRHEIERYERLKWAITDAEFRSKLNELIAEAKAKLKAVEPS